MIIQYNDFKEIECKFYLQRWNSSISFPLRKGAKFGENQESHR